MDALTSEIIAQAKRVAASRNEQTLELGSVLGGLTLLREHEAIKAGVAECLGITATELHWPDFLLQRGAAAEAVPIEPTREQRFELGPVFKKIFNSLYRQSREMPLPQFLQSILKSREAMEFEEVKALHAAQGKADSGISDPPHGMLSRLRDLSARKTRLEKELARDVIGQPDALQMLAEHYLSTLKNPSTSGLRGIFTFMGPSGVGKTMLAERFAGALSIVEGENYGTIKVSMEMADKESLLITLFGLDEAYKSSKTGLIHDKVMENPRQVIIFDEVEKAPPEIIRSLLTLLNDGSIADRYNGAKVDLAKCFVIFTTNLGQELFSSRNRSGILRGNAFTSDELFDLLTSAKRHEHTKLDQASSALPPEFVSRLRKGGVVLFNQLSGRDYLQLFNRLIERKNSPGIASPRFEIDDTCKQLVLLTLLPDISPRRVVAEVGMLCERWTADLLENPPDGLVAKNPESFCVAMKLALDPGNEGFLKNIRANQSLKILVVDNDERMTRFVRRYVDENHGGIQISIERVKELGKTADEIGRLQPELLLLDLDLPETEACRGGGLGLHRRVVDAAPDLPVFLFSESPDWEKKLPVIVDQGGARGFFHFKEDVENLLVAEDQIARFHRLLLDALFEKILAGLIRTRRKLEFSYHFEFDSASDAVWICLHRLAERQVVSLAEESGGIRPAEIPSVSFDDVFGLDRAKERLRDAVDFLKNPARLAAFGIRPPVGYLLAGPTGTGKTHLARAVANEARCVFYSLSAGELESKWIGEGEERIRQLFQAARKYAPALIFIDEIDAIASTRSLSAGGSNHSVKLLNQLLVCMDGFAESRGQILVLAATNRPDSLDPAILRPGRFDEIVRIEAPDAKAREQMFRRRLKSLPLEHEVLKAVPQLVCRTAGMSPAEVDRIIRETVYLAVRESRKSLRLADFETACNLVRYGADRRDLIVKDQDRRRIAWHEAGHVIARLSLFPDSKIDYVSIVPNEAGAMGFAAWQKDESQHSLSAEDYRKLIAIAFAGREAEKLCPGAGPEAINTGASSDFEYATSLAWDAVSRYGFDPESGPFSLAGLPRDLHGELMESMKPRVDDLLQLCLEDSKGLLKEKEQVVGKLAQALLQKQALDGLEVLAITGC